MPTCTATVAAALAACLIAAQPGDTVTFSGSLPPTTLPKTTAAITLDLTGADVTEMVVRGSENLSIKGGRFRTAPAPAKPWKSRPTTIALWLYGGKNLSVTGADFTSDKIDDGTQNTGISVRGVAGLVITQNTFHDLIEGIAATSISDARVTYNTATNVQGDGRIYSDITRVEDGWNYHEARDTSIAQALGIHPDCGQTFTGAGVILTYEFHHDICIGATQGSHNTGDALDLSRMSDVNIHDNTIITTQAPSAIDAYYGSNVRVTANTVGSLDGVNQPVIVVAGVSSGSVIGNKVYLTTARWNTAYIINAAKAPGVTFAGNAFVVSQMAVPIRALPIDYTPFKTWLAAHPAMPDAATTAWLGAAPVVP